MRYRIVLSHAVPRIGPGQNHLLGARPAAAATSTRTAASAASTRRHLSAPASRSAGARRSIRSLLCRRPHRKNRNCDQAEQYQVFASIG